MVSESSMPVVLKRFLIAYHFCVPVMSSRTTLFQEKSMCQIPFDQKSGKPELTQMQREQNGCEKF